MSIHDWHVSGVFFPPFPSIHASSQAMPKNVEIFAQEGWLIQRMTLEST